MSFKQIYVGTRNEEAKHPFNLKLKSQGTTAMLSSYQLLLNTYAQSKYANEVTVKCVASKFTVPNKIVC